MEGNLRCAGRECASNESHSTVHIAKDGMGSGGMMDADAHSMDAMDRTDTDASTTALKLSFQPLRQKDQPLLPQEHHVYQKLPSFHHDEMRVMHEMALARDDAGQGDRNQKIHMIHSKEHRGFHRGVLRSNSCNVANVDGRIHCRSTVVAPYRQLVLDGVQLADWIAE